MSDAKANVPIYIERLRKPAGVPPAIQRECADIMQWQADEIERLQGLIENANLASAETQPSWKHRCYAIMDALGQDYGDPDWEMPDDAKKKDAEIERLLAALERIAKGCDLSNEAQAIAREALRDE